MALTEGALDLSAKPFDSRPASPAHSYASDADGRADRPASVVSSDAEDPGHMSPRRKRPALAANGGGFSPRGYPPHHSPRASPELSPRSGGSVASTPRSSPATSASPSGHGIGCSPASTLASPTAAAAGNSGSSSYPPGSGLSPTGTSRPFKLYPFEPLPSMYSQLAAAASQGMYGFGSAAPTTPAAMSPAMNLFDNAISLSSPIGQYLQQKKRRLETREISKSGSMSSLPSPPTGPPPPSGYMSGGDDSSNHDGSTSGLMDGDKKIKSVPEDKKDEAYWERRRKNNEAAKRSRDARRAKEEEIALRAAFLEQENLKLRAQVAILKNETAKLHYMLYNRM